LSKSQCLGFYLGVIFGETSTAKPAKVDYSPTI
jgi:hypothetical protein